jgi:hypothetical protein
LPYIWVAQCLSQTIQNLIKNKASKGGGGESNLDHKGLAHVTRKICTPTLENTQQPTRLQNIQPNAQENIHSSLSYQINCLHDIDYHKKKSKYVMIAHGL